MSFKIVDVLDDDMISGLEGGFDSMIASSEEEVMVTERKQFQCDTIEKKPHNILHQ